MTPTAKLRVVKNHPHGSVGIFASAVLLIPVAAWVEDWGTTLLLIGGVTFECVILVLSGMRCPLTPVAARYTDDRADNFDIYLPLWLARYNKQIFGGLFGAGMLFAAVRRFV